MLLGLLLVVQVLISVLMVIVILLQASKGGGLAGIAGGLASSTVFGGRTAANFLTKSTAILATLFFINCLGMAMLTAHTDTTASVTQQAVQSEGMPSPVPSIPGGSSVPADAGVTTAPAAPAQQPATTPTQPTSGGN